MAVLTRLQVAVAPTNISNDTYVTFPNDTDLANSAEYSLTNVDADFLSMDTLTVVAEYSVRDAGADDTYGLRCRITNGAQILAAANSAGQPQEIVNNITNTTDITSGAVTFAYVNTGATKADWNAATVRWQQTWTKNMGTDGNAVQVDYGHFDGTYTPSAATSDGVGDSAGTSTASGIGEATFAGDGLAAGTSTASGTGASFATISSVGDAAGSSTSTAVGAATFAGAGSSSGSSTTTAVGSASTIETGAGSSSGSSTTTAVGASFFAGIGSAVAVATAIAVGASTFTADGSSDGTSAVTGVSAATAEVVGVSTGSSTASGIGETVGSPIQSGVGSANGSSTATGEGEATSTATGASEGAATATGVGEATFTATGSANGSSTASGVGTTGGSVQSGAGASSGTSTTTGSATAIFAADGSSDGTSAVTGVSAATAEVVGVSTGSSTASGIGEAVGAPIQSGVGAANGSSTATSVGASTGASTGAADGLSVAIGVGEATFSAAGTGDGSATANALSATILAFTGSSTGGSTATAIGEATFEAVGSSSGTSTATATAVPAGSVGWARGSSGGAAAVGVTVGGASSRTIRRTAPLSPHVPLVDPRTGTPSPFFMRWWQDQVRTNAAVAELSTPEAVSAVLDALDPAAAQGDILYRGAALWSRLAAGTSGFALLTQGTGADPIWGDTALAMDDLTDVDTATTPPTDGQVLVWVDADAEWQPATPAAAGTTVIDDLTDVDTATTPPTDGQTLVWSAADSEWQPATPTGGSPASEAQVTGISYTATDADLAGNKTLLVNNASGCVITIPAALTNKESLDVIQIAAGQAVITAGAGVTLQSADGLVTTRVQFSWAKLTPSVGVANLYYLRGDLVLRATSNFVPSGSDRFVPVGSDVYTVAAVFVDVALIAADELFSADLGQVVDADGQDVYVSPVGLVFAGSDFDAFEFAEGGALVVSGGLLLASNGDTLLTSDLDRLLI